MALVSDFRTKVLDVVSQIKVGETLSYGEVARRAGSPKAARAVGNILNKNFNPQIPCHRVIRADGQVGGYNRGGKAKIRRLKQEGAKLVFGLTSAKV
ncbi:MAG TPA: MGMT family protein [Candidatus Paceibacterota bacterium]|jgi:methylated-DNA-[protein]-cysteine S-methyltransferase|nr:MGMT family protein [Candidatus Paceibacterota bacterium]HPI24543.1 MGMT family protein [Candidatus Paceibacterota bacterium]HPV33269.1 MGMT family protein [Candidatus Paceibacterota bacterium]HPY13138.1 MGMT family protein [Candidatus Paceibacterota bacterium]HQB27182.1 MGMT family protein [Candidatus Paceibacterota bacterium]